MMQSPQEIMIIRQLDRDLALAGDRAAQPPDLPTLALDPGRRTPSDSGHDVGPAPTPCRSADRRQ